MTKAIEFHYIGIPLIAHDFHIVVLLAFICHRDKLCTPTFFMLCYFVFCRNFCAPQCACTAVLRSPGGWWGTVFPGVGKDKGGRGYNMCCPSAATIQAWGHVQLQF